MQTRRLTIFAALAVAAGLATGCDDEQEPVFVPEGSGAISGVAFYDVTRNNVYDPESGDTLLRGVTIKVTARGDTAIVLATALTDDQGRFSIPTLPPGTHDVIARPSTGQSGFAFCRPVPTTVYRNESAFAALAARIACVQPIVQVEDEALNSVVTIKGVIVASPGTFRNDNAYLQDSTGGIQLFGTGTAALAVGDTVEVTGRLTEFSRERELVDMVFEPGRPNGGAPTDTVLTAAQVALLGPFDRPVGRLVTVRAGRVSAFGGTTQNSNVTDASGGIFQLRLDGNVFSLSRIRGERFDPAKCYDITGALGIFNTTLQLKPRQASDVVEVPCP
ncbi:MAG TPA: hypothetical protein VKA84_23615 [Gemmatimonadaceae bacterium]|nr:hypothetical protein [Gemmatimonadaceae bacterium]